MKYLLPLLTLFILMSCSSDDDGDNNQGETQETLLLKKVFKDGELIREYEYYADNKLKSQVGPLVNDQIFELFYEYVSDTLIVSYIKVETSSVIQTLKSYSVNNTTARTDYYSSENVLIRFDKYTFNNNICGPIIYEHFNSNGAIITSRYFSFIDENCSVNTIYEGYGYKNSTSINDNKKSVFESITSSFTRQEVMHNAVEVRVMDYNDQIVNSRSYNTEYEYNSDDYPIKETSVFLDGSSLIYTFEYY